jgi:predicted nucleotidyltransferase
MKRDEILQLLAAHRQELARFSVKSLAIFGSVARDEARPDSDVDILVEFAEAVGLFEFVRLKDYLETLLDRPVDLVSPDALKEQLRERILKEAVHAG